MRHFVLFIFLLFPLFAISQKDDIKQGIQHGYYGSTVTIGTKFGYGIETENWRYSFSLTYDFEQQKIPGKRVLGYWADASYQGFGIGKWSFPISLNLKHGFGENFGEGFPTSFAQLIELYLGYGWSFQITDDLEIEHRIMGGAYFQRIPTSVLLSEFDWNKGQSAASTLTLRFRL